MRDADSESDSEDLRAERATQNGCLEEGVQRSAKRAADTTAVDGKPGANLTKDGPAVEAPTEAAAPRVASTSPQPLSRGLRSLRRRWARGRQRLAAATTASRRSAGDGGDFLVDDEPPRSAGDHMSAADVGSEAAVPLGDAWLVVDNKGTVVAEEAGASSDPLTKCSMEAKVYQLLTWMLAPAIHGIPKLGVPGAADRSDELLARNGRDVDAAVREVVAGSERTVSLLVLNFCLERIPVLGCPTVLLRTTWGNLRSILIIAALYGHNLEAPRVQHEALLCLVPPGEDRDAPALQPVGDARGLAQLSLVSETAQKVARVMIKSALRRATGLQAAVDCFELASLLYSSCGRDAVDDDGFVHVMATPASAARDFFRRKSLASCALLWGSLPLLLLGTIAQVLFAAAKWAPTVAYSIQAFSQRLPACFRESTPALLLAAVGLGISFRSFRRIAGRRHGHRRGFARWAFRMRNRRESLALREAWPQIVTVVVFTLHALLPAASTYSALSVILDSMHPRDGTPTGPIGWDILHRLSCAMLGLYSLCSVMIHQLQGDNPEFERLEAGKFLRSILRCLHITVAASKGCCVLAAWTYASLAMDLGASHLVQWLGMYLEGGTALGVVGPLAWMLGADSGISPLQSDRAVAFTLNLVSVASQQRLVELLSKREVLLRLIGAERVMASTLCLLLKGVAVACSSSKTANPIAEFLTSVAPPPLCCIVIVTLRSQALLVGASLVLAPRIVSSGWLGSSSSFILGTMAGCYAAQTFLCMWYESRADLDSPALRLALLVPGGVSSRAKGLLRGALVGARTRAVQMMAMGILQRAVRWWCTPRQ